MNHINLSRLIAGVSLAALVIGCSLVAPAESDGTALTSTEARLRLADLDSDLNKFSEDLVAEIASTAQQIGPNVSNCPASDVTASSLSDLWSGSVAEADGEASAALTISIDKSGNLISAVRNGVDIWSFEVDFVGREIQGFETDEGKLTCKPVSSLVECLSGSTRQFLLDYSMLCDVDEQDGGAARIIRRLTMLLVGNPELTELVGAGVSTSEVIATTTSGRAVGTTSSASTVQMTRM
jgi:hypothetical protein